VSDWVWVAAGASGWLGVWLDGPPPFRDVERTPNAPLFPLGGPVWAKADVEVCRFDERGFCSLGCGRDGPPDTDGPHACGEGEGYELWRADTDDGAEAVTLCRVKASPRRSIVEIAADDAEEAAEDAGLDPDVVEALAERAGLKARVSALESALSSAKSTSPVVQPEGHECPARAPCEDDRCPEGWSNTRGHAAQVHTVHLLAFGASNELEDCRVLGVFATQEKAWAALNSHDERTAKMPDAEMFPGWCSIHEVALDQLDP
jgi:hypothetical protein